MKLAGSLSYAKGGEDNRGRKWLHLDAEHTVGVQPHEAESALQADLRAPHHQIQLQLRHLPAGNFPRHGDGNCRRASIQFYAPVQKDIIS